MTSPRPRALDRDTAWVTMPDAGEIARVNLP
jgi:hypothetical protein